MYPVIFFLRIYFERERVHGAGGGWGGVRAWERRREA